MERLKRPMMATAIFLSSLQLGCEEKSMSPGSQTPAGMNSMPTGELDALWGPVNADCPNPVPPYSGRGAPRGACCFRGEPNSVAVERQGDGPAVKIGYRMNYQVQTNHPDSLSNMTLMGLAITRSENEEQSLLVSFTGPRQNGELGSGPGTITVGQGRYNCDGTYSYYSNTAAPTGRSFPGGDDPGRWQKQIVNLTYDGTKSGRAASTIAFEDNYNGRSYTVFVKPDTFEYDWEIVTQAFDITKISTAVEDLDCQGTRGSAWMPGAEFIVFTALEDNHFKDNGISQLNGMTFAQLVSFGLVADAMKLATLDPLETPRCMPQLGTPMAERTCPWVKLPESLCPKDEAERGLFRCHIGWEGNPDGEPTNCTQTAPTSPRNDPNGDEGQCCDPLGDPSSGLPACNAFILRTDVVAAAAEIGPDGPIVTKCPVQ